MKHDAFDLCMAVAFTVLSLGCAFPLVCLGIAILNGTVL